jgi:hypothetical protein
MEWRCHPAPVSWLIQPDIDADVSRYGNIRIDPIHYCPLEDKLRNNRRKKLKYRTIDPEDDFVYDPNNDAANETMKLLASTFRDNSSLGDMVLSLKLPHTIKEAANADLGRAVSVCPNLRYVDLGKAFFAGDSQFDILRLELWMNCPQLRTMSYRHGAERYFFALSGDKWANLEAVTIIGLHVDAVHMRVVLAHLKNLQTLHLEGIPKLNDDLFMHQHGLPAMPAVEDLQLYSLPEITSKGLVAYCEDPLVENTLQRLTLNETGVIVSTLHEVLAVATRLWYLAVVETPADPLSLTQPLCLRSDSLEQLHFEISDAYHTWGNSMRITVQTPPSDSYYNYLLASISMRGMPALRKLYVRDPSFPEALSRLHSTHSEESPQPESRRISIPNTLLSPPKATAMMTPTTSQEVARGTAVLSKRMRRLLLQDSDDSVIEEEEEETKEDNSASAVAVTEEPHALEVYTKGQDEELWVFAQTVPHSTFHSSHHGRRPVSTISAEWDGSARRSVFMMDSAGGFRALPEY